MFQDTNDNKNNNSKTDSDQNLYRDEIKHINQLSMYFSNSLPTSFSYQEYSNNYENRIISNSEESLPINVSINQNESLNISTSRSQCANSCKEYIRDNRIITDFNDSLSRDVSIDRNESSTVSTDRNHRISGYCTEYCTKNNSQIANESDEFFREEAFDQNESLSRSTDKKQCINSSCNLKNVNNSPYVTNSKSFLSNGIHLLENGLSERINSHFYSPDKFYFNHSSSSSEEEDNHYIYTYKGNNHDSADLRDSLLSLNLSRNEQMGNNRSVSPDMDFLEMDFDPGPINGQNSDEDISNMPPENSSSETNNLVGNNQNRSTTLVQTNEPVPGSSNSNIFISESDGCNYVENSIVLNELNCTISVEHDIRNSGTDKNNKRVNVGNNNESTVDIGEKNNSGHANFANYDIRNNGSNNLNSLEYIRNDDKKDEIGFDIRNGGCNDNNNNYGLEDFTEYGNEVIIGNDEENYSDNNVNSTCSTTVISDASFNDIKILLIQNTKQPSFNRLESQNITCNTLWNNKYFRFPDTYRKELQQDFFSAYSTVFSVLETFKYNYSMERLLNTLGKTKECSSSNLLGYLFEKSTYGISTHHLMNSIDEISNGRLYTRFFPTYPERNFLLLQFLNYWMNRNVIPIVTRNIQPQGLISQNQILSNPWIHNVAYKIDNAQIYLSEPFEFITEDNLFEQLAQPSVTFCTREPIMSRWNSKLNLKKLLTDFDVRWQEENVLGQITNMVREYYNESRTRSYIIRIPHMCCSGITLVVPKDSQFCKEVQEAPEFPLK